MYQLHLWLNQLSHPTGIYYIKETHATFYMVSRRGLDGLWRINKTDVRRDNQYE